MQLSDLITVAIITNIGGPSILFLLNRFLTPKNNLGAMIEDVKKSLEAYKVEQASLALSQKNWDILKSGDKTNFSYREWIMLYNNLAKLVPEEQWGEPLLSDTIKARKILEGE